MDLATNLVSLRKQKGLTQMDLAEKLNVSRQAISRWEVGAAVPSTDNLIVLSNLYGISVDSILKDDLSGIMPQSEPPVKPHINKEGNKKLRIIVASSLLVLALILVILTVVSILHGRSDASDLPMDNMTVEADDDIDGTFSFG